MYGDSDITWGTETKEDEGKGMGTGQSAVVKIVNDSLRKKMHRDVGSRIDCSADGLENGRGLWWRT